MFSATGVFLPYFVYPFPNKKKKKKKKNENLIIFSDTTCSYCIGHAMRNVIYLKKICEWYS